MGNNINVVQIVQVWFKSPSAFSLGGGEVGGGENKPVESEGNTGLVSLLKSFNCFFLLCAILIIINVKIRHIDQCLYSSYL